MPLKEICGNHKESNAATMEINAPSVPQLMLTTTHLLGGRFCSRSSLLLRWGRSSGLTHEEPLPTWLNFYSKELSLKHSYSTLLHCAGLLIQHRSRGNTHSTSYSTLLLKVTHSLYRPGWRLPKLARINKTSTALNSKEIWKNVPFFPVFHPRPGFQYTVPD